MCKYVLLSFFVINLAIANPKPVTVAELSKIAIYPQQTVPATVLSLQNSEISAEITGKIIEVNVDVGNTVNKDDNLASIECNDYVLNLKQAEASLQAIKSEIDFAKWQLTRAKKLATSNLGTEELVKKNEADLAKLSANQNQQQALIAHAKNNIARCSINAPYTGVVTERSVSVGELVSPGIAMFRITTVMDIEVEAKLHTNEAEQILNANELAFILGGEEYPVTIRTIIPVQDPKSRTQILRLVFVKQKPIPGSAGRLKWQVNKPAIPAELLLYNKDKLGVFVAKDGKAKFINLDNAIEGQPVIVNNELPGPVIINGRHGLEDNHDINIMNHE